jgi:transposase InsO family protein
MTNWRKIIKWQPLKGACGCLRRRRREKISYWPIAGLLPLSGRNKKKKPAGRQKLNIRGIWGSGHICRQTFIDTYAKVLFRKPYGRKNAPVAADTLNDAITPFFDSHGFPPLRVLTDRGGECCGNRERREYALYLEVENTGRAGTKVKSPRTDGICERFNRTRKDGFCSTAAFRRKACQSVTEIQPGPSQRVRRYNEDNMLTKKRAPAIFITGVCPLGAHVVPL